jgi:hypothetical protein
MLVFVLLWLAGPGRLNADTISGVVKDPSGVEVAGHALRSQAGR